jgi:hypothetical protein
VLENRDACVVVEQKLYVSEPRSVRGTRAVAVS